MINKTPSQISFLFGEMRTIPESEVNPLIRFCLIICAMFVSQFSQALARAADIGGLSQRVPKDATSKIFSNSDLASAWEGQGMLEHGMG